MIEQEQTTGEESAVSAAPCELGALSNNATPGRRVMTMRLAFGVLRITERSVQVWRDDADRVGPSRLHDLCDKPDGAAWVTVYSEKTLTALADATAEVVELAADSDERARILATSLVEYTNRVVTTLFRAKKRREARAAKATATVKVSS